MNTFLAGKSQVGVGVANEFYSGPVNTGRVYINRGKPGHFQLRWRDEHRVQTEDQQKYQKLAEIQEIQQRLIEINRRTKPSAETTTEGDENERGRKDKSRARSQEQQQKDFCELRVCL